MPDSQRIEARLQELWTLARGPGGGADRPAYSSAEAAAMQLVAGWAGEAGLEPGLDAFGNLWALPLGVERVFTAGSHVDTVPDGGRYDGALGTVLGLELALEREDAGILICAAEEAPRFGAGTLGSRLLAGTLRSEDLAGMSDAEGVSAADALTGYLDALSDLPRVEPPLGRVRAHGEIHVAQRRALRELGVVTRVASPRRLEVVIDGQAGHSGEVSMEERRDALAAAASVVLAVESAARAEPPETVATVGRLSVSPGAISVIPARVVMLLDLRGVDKSSLDRVEGEIRAFVEAIAADREVEAEVSLLRGGDPVSLDPELARRALAAAQGFAIPVAETWSGAGHDAQHLAALLPTLLVFVPLHGGESHTPEEGADMAEILAAARVVSAALS
ncbi:MAG: hydantoinase/carbamoylase family amidase [Solirubrobacteraceae bacterium]